MREIKFRAWNIKEKCMYQDVHQAYDWGACDNGPIKVPATSFGEITNDNEQWIVEQFTGLKDKNGKNIYEGDILNVGWKNIIEFKKEIMMVEYNELLHFCGFWPFRYFNAGRPIEVEIIGNIHENPELMS